MVVMADRSEIPIDVKRAMLFECCHRCAVDGVPVQLENAHIIPWCETQDHSPENLVCLCALCHDRSHREGWDEKTLRMYKESPWAMRQYANAGFVPSTTSIVEFTLAGIQVADISDEIQRQLPGAIAAFLKVPPNQIRMTSAKSAGWSIAAISPDPSHATTQATIPSERMDVHRRSGNSAALRDVTLIPHVLSEPTAIFKGWNREGFENALCYVGVPRSRLIADNIEAPAPSGMVFLVYVTADGAIVNWEWTKADETDQTLPAHYSERFGSTVLLPGGITNR